ncbi:hypothetical protein BSKO_13582 [Bryopsis sp. KO-2023]|nr:hypothetical protein BSKO_13582 [Bryopsis sp. KO-2023]
MSAINDPAAPRPSNRISDVKIGTLNDRVLEDKLDMSEDHDLLKEVSKVPETVHRFRSPATKTINASSIAHEQGVRFPVAEDEISAGGSIALEIDIPPAEEAAHSEFADSVENNEFNHLLLGDRLGKTRLGESSHERSPPQEVGEGVTTCMEQGWDFDGGQLLGRGTYGSVVAVDLPVVIQLCEPGPSADDRRRKAGKRAELRHPHLVDFLAALRDGSETQGVVLKSFSNETLADIKDENM